MADAAEDGQLEGDGTFLVADTSILIGALPFIRAVVECEQVAYTLYVPYVVLTELDRGRTAAPVNQLISRHMRQRNKRVVAQDGPDHDRVFTAKGVVANNDDLIMGAALKLRDEGNDVIMLTNDHNLVSKCCANRLRTMTSLDLMMFIPNAIATMDRFILRDIQALCPHRKTISEFSITLLCCALKSQLASIDADFSPSSTAGHLVYEIIDRTVSAKMVADLSMLAKTKDVVRECRLKGPSIQMEDVRRLMKFICAILEGISNQVDIVCKLLNICKGIYAGMKVNAKKSSSLSFAPDAYQPVQVSVSAISTNQQKQIASVLTASRKKGRETQKIGGEKKSSPKKKSLKSIEKNTKRRKDFRSDKDIDDAVESFRGSEPQQHNTDANATSDSVGASNMSSVKLDTSLSAAVPAKQANRKILTATRSSARIASKRDSVQPLTETCSAGSVSIVPQPESDSTRIGTRILERRTLKSPGHSPRKRSLHQDIAFNDRSVPKLVTETDEMEVEDADVVIAAKRQLRNEETEQLNQQDQMSALVNVETEPVYQMLDMAWKHLNNCTGSWAELCKVPYPFTYTKILWQSVRGHQQLSHWITLVAQVSEFYERLLKLNFTVSRNIQVEVAKRFLSHLGEAWAAALPNQIGDSIQLASAAEVLEFFQDSRKRVLMSGGLDQLKAFRGVLEQCDKNMLNELLQKMRRKVNDSKNTTT